MWRFHQGYTFHFVEQWERYRGAGDQYSLGNNPRLAGIWIVPDGYVICPESLVPACRDDFGLEMIRRVTGLGYQKDWGPK
jgi:hypothetical protein